MAANMADVSAKQHQQQQKNIKNSITSLSIKLGTNFFFASKIGFGIQVT